MYIAIDGDDTGHKITACYLNNDKLELAKISGALRQLTEEISEFLAAGSFEIIFSAADGVVASTDLADCNWMEIFSKIQAVAPPGYNFSAGVGGTLREAYVALLNSKSSGKNRMSDFADMKDCSDLKQDNA